MDTNVKIGLPPHPVESSPRPGDPIEANLSLWDAVSIIVGIIIGVGIFETPQTIFREVPHPAIAILVWVLGGVLAFLGALCFAELASAYPRSGGEYVYLTRAFGPLTGFLFAWSQLTVTRSGSVAALAYIFGQSTASLFGLQGTAVFVLAAVSVLGLSMVNIIGVRMGTTTQNVLTVAKVLGLAALVVVGFVWGDRTVTVPDEPVVPSVGWFAWAMILVLWTYSGWHEAAYIVAEAKHRTRNIPLALMIGAAIVTVIYLAVNMAFLYGLDFEGAKHERAAVNLVSLAMPTYGARIMDALILVSSLGAINGMIFTTARIYTAFGRDHRLFKTMSHWSKRTKTPARAIAVQCAVCLSYIGAVWYMEGGKNAFDTAVLLTAAVFWMFFFLTGVSLFLLRVHDPDTPRPFRVPGYPIVPLIFCGWCGYMVIGSVLYDAEKSLIGLCILFAGLPFYFIPRKLKERKPEENLQPVSK